MHDNEDDIVVLADNDDILEETTETVPLLQNENQSRDGDANSKPGNKGPECLLEPANADCWARLPNKGKKLAKKRLPILEWLPKYQLSYLLSDLIAGITVGLTAIPQGIAYATVAGVPPQMGLYASIMGAFGYTLLGSSKDISVGPTAIMALMTSAYSGREYGTSYAVLLAFLNGIVIFACGLLQLGFLIDLISMPVIAGFTSAACITISSGQVKSLLGLTIANGTKSHTHLGVVDDWADVFNNISTCRYQDAVLGIVSAIILLLLRWLGRVSWFKPSDGSARGVQAALNRLNPKLLLVIGKVVWFICTARNAVVVIASLLMAAIQNPDCPQYLIDKKNNTPTNSSCIWSITGDIAAGLPPFTLPPFGTPTETFGEMVQVLGVTVFVVPLVAVLEHIAIAKAFAAGRPLDASQEMIALGLCNVAASFISSMPITGSFSRTAVNAASGVRTQLGCVATGLLVMLCLAVLMPYCAFIPKATLSAVIIIALIFNVEYDVILPMWRSKKLDLIPAFACFFVCLFYSLEVGIGVGVAIQVLFILYHTARPSVHVQLLKIPGSEEEYLQILISQGVVFPSVTYVRNLIGKAASKQASSSIPVVIDCTRMSQTDFTAAKSFKALIGDLKSRQIRIYWLRPAQHVAHTLAAVAGNNFMVIQDVSELRGEEACEKGTYELGLPDEELKAGEAASLNTNGVTPATDQLDTQRL